MIKIKRDKAQPALPRLIYCFNSLLSLNLSYSARSVLSTASAMLLHSSLINISFLLKKLFCALVKPFNLLFGLRAAGRGILPFISPESMFPTIFFLSSIMVVRLSRA